MKEILELAHTALERLISSILLAEQEPPERDSDDWNVARGWCAWHDNLMVDRAALDHAVEKLLAHPEYPRSHKACWGDLVTVSSTTSAAWAPVARKLLRDASLARGVAAGETTTYRGPKDRIRR